MILGVIPARGGSKGVPGKNIREVCGKPLIAYAIRCGLECGLIDELVVSTDLPQIADIARKFGAKVPFMRPANLAEDTTPMLPVLVHAITESEKYFLKKAEAIVLLDPTGPLRIPADLKESLRIFRESGCDAVISGSRAHRNPWFNMVKKQGEAVSLVMDGNFGRRQDAPEVFDLNTVVWIYSRKAVMEEKARIPKNTQLYIVPPERAIDLDTEMDFRMLEFFIKEGGKA